MEIKDRALGADISPEIKQKLALRQELNRSVDVNEAINNVETRYGRIPDQTYVMDFKDGDKGLADLSSRTPFARMWVALKTYTMGKAAPCYKKGEESKGLEECKENDPNYAIFSHDGFFQKEIKKTNQPPQIYQIGNHVLNMLENSEVNESRVPIDDSGVLMSELAANPFLKPQSGILSLSSETKSPSSAPIGILKETTVNFVVHNFQDFEKIYRPYFLRAGALVFIDYGWSTADLYDPNELKFEEDNIENKVLELIENAAGDLDIIMGYVKSYDAKVKENGSIECSVTVTSQNSALIEVKINSELLSMIGDAVTTEIDNKKYMRWGDFEDRILNPLVGFSDPTDTKTVQNGPRFNSSGSYARYLPGLTKEKNVTSFQYPTNWATKDIDTGEDVEHNRIPVRDLLFHHDVLHPTEGGGEAPSGPIISSNNTINNYIDGILNWVNKNQDEIIKLEKYSNSYAHTTISICDSNYLRDVDSGVNDPLDAAGTTSSEFANFFMFQPGSPQSIVKTYDLSFTMPKGDLQNKIAIESRGSNQGFFPIHNKMDQLIAGAVIEQSHVEKLISGYAKYLPGFSNMPESIEAGSEKDTTGQETKNIVFTADTSPITWLNLTLSIYGISSLAPGDLFRVDYLPGYQLDNTFFRITGISHDISPSTWTTTLTTIQQFLYKAKETEAGLAWRKKNKEELGDPVPKGKPSKSYDSGLSEEEHRALINAVEGVIKNRTPKEALRVRLIAINVDPTDENLNPERVAKLEAEFKEKNKNKFMGGGYGEDFTIFDHCRDKSGNPLGDYPVFKYVIKRLGDLRYSRVQADEPFKQKHIDEVWLLKDLKSDCNVRMVGEASEGCDTSTGLKPNGFPCEYKGYGHNKKIQKLWEEAQGKYTTGKHYVLGAGVAELQKGESYWLIQNSSITSTHQKGANYVLAPRVETNFPQLEDYDFNIDMGAHVDIINANDKKCEYGWEENYECQSTYDWSDSEIPVSKIAIINDETPNPEGDIEAVVDWNVDYTKKNPVWAQFSTDYDQYFKRPSPGHNITMWEYANYNIYDYFIDCNPTSDCYLKAFSANKKMDNSPMGIFDWTTGEVQMYGKEGYALLRGSSYMDDNNQYYPGAISGVFDGQAIVIRNPFCSELSYSTDDGGAILTIESSFDLSENSRFFKENDNFKLFCEEFTKHGSDIPTEQQLDEVFVPKEVHFLQPRSRSGRMY